MTFRKSQRSKYGNRKTEVNGILFASQKEATRYGQLLMMERGGYIMDLRLQVKFELLPPVFLDGKKQRATYYIADFVYYLDHKMIVEDVKGYRTEVYKLKRKHMMARYGIEVKET